jgi:hypothetical protein
MEAITLEMSLGDHTWLIAMAGYIDFSLNEGTHLKSLGQGYWTLIAKRKSGFQVPRIQIPIRSNNFRAVTGVITLENLC